MLDLRGDSGDVDPQVEPELRRRHILVVGAHVLGTLRHLLQSGGRRLRVRAGRVQVEQLSVDVAAVQVVPVPEDDELPFDVRNGR